MPFVGFYQIKKIINTQKITTPFLVLISTTILLAFNLFSFINLKAVNILFWDQWDLYQAFFNQSNFIQIFRWQHGPIRQGIAFNINGILQQLTTWNTHTESLFIGVIILISCILAIILKYILFRRFEYADVIIPLIFLNLSQFEIFIGTPNPSHGSFSLLFLILYMLSWSIKNNFKKHIFVNIFNFFSIYTGMGLFIGAITPFLFLLDYFKQHISFKLFFSSIMLSILSLGSFFINYHNQTAAECFIFPDPHIYLYPLFISRMFSNFFSLQSFGIISYLLGLLFLTILFFILIKTLIQTVKEKNNNQYVFRIVLITLLTFPIIFAINTSIGRLCLGINTADSSRYATYLIPAFLGFYFYLSNLKQNSIKNIFTLFFAVILLYGNLTAVSKPEIRWYFEGKTNWKQCYLNYENIDYCDRTTNFKIYPNPTATNLKSKLEYLKTHRLNLYNQN